MNRARWQFSLRQLLVVLTFVAAVVAFVTQYPGVALLFLVLSPVVTGAQVLACVIKNTASYSEHRAPRITRLIYLLFGVVCVAGSLVGWFVAQRDSPISGGTWFVLTIFASGGLMFFYYAWLIPVAPVSEKLDDC